MTTFYFAIVPWGIGLDELMPNAELIQGALKERGEIFLGRGKPVGEFRTVVGLDTFNGIGKHFNAVPDKLSRGIGAVLLKGLQIA